MKPALLFSLSLTVACLGRADTFTSYPDAAVPDFDFNGLADTIEVSGLDPNAIRDVNVSLEIGGGWNGDYYAYLWHAGQSAVLLNRVGRTATNPDGYSDRGFGPGALGGNFSLDDQATADVHLYQSGDYASNAGQLTGLWQPDGRRIDPEAPGVDFDRASRSAMLGVFNGGDANGDWSLYLVDASPGAMGRLVSWELTVTQVPEPGALALGLVATGWVAVVLGWHSRRGRMPDARCQTSWRAGVLPSN
jgi:hypothetical protein